MSTTQKDKSSGKPRQRSRKADQRQKPEAQPAPQRDEAMEDQISTLMADAIANDAASPAEVPLIDEVAPAEVPLVDDIAPVDAVPADTAAPVHHRPVSIQAIANAYEEYTKRSLQESQSLVGKLMGVRSFDKVIEIQTEYARQAYVNFVAESQKICELYNELARQIWRPWESLAADVTQTRR
jgi:hypothetical protein